MDAEGALDERTEKTLAGGESGVLGDLEGKIDHLLMRYQEIKIERDELASSLNVEREKAARLEKKLDLLSQDRDRVKTRIDQLLYRLKGIDI